MRCVITIILVAIVAGCASQMRAKRQGVGAALSDRRIATLNGLRNAVNSTYGFHEGNPRINLGPCGRFAKLFREQWNSRFREKVTITFVLINTPTGPYCGHVLVKLPEGAYFDGGNGVVTAAALRMQFPGTYLAEMKDFDLKLLDKHSGGLNRDYPICPDYSDKTTARLIESHLELLPKETKE